MSDQYPEKRIGSAKNETDKRHDRTGFDRAIEQALDNWAGAGGTKPVAFEVIISENPGRIDEYHVVFGG